MIDLKSKKEMIKPFVWGIVAGAIVIMILGFAVFGWTLGSTAEKMAQEAADKAVVDNLASICVAQFEQDANKEELLKELKGKSSWDRRGDIEKGGWATMPGQKEPKTGVAEECAKRLTE